MIATIATTTISSKPKLPMAGYFTPNPESRIPNSDRSRLPDASGSVHYSEGDARKGPGGRRGTGAAAPDGGDAGLRGARPPPHEGAPLLLPAADARRRGGGGAVAGRLREGVPGPGVVPRRVEFPELALPDRDQPSPRPDSWPPAG